MYQHYNQIHQMYCRAYTLIDKRRDDMGGASQNNNQFVHVELGVTISIMKMTLVLACGRAMLRYYLDLPFQCGSKSIVL